MSNLTTTTDYWMAVIALSKSTLAAQHGASVLLCAFGVQSIVFNSVVITTIVRTPSLRGKKYFVLFINLASADLLTGLSFTTVTAQRIYRFYNDMPAFATAMNCLKDVFAMSFPIISSVYFTLLISVDRCFAVMLPLYYCRKNRWYLPAMCATGWCLGLLDASFLFTTLRNPNAIVPLCTNQGTQGPAYNDWSTSSSLALTVASMTLSLLSLGVMYIRLRGSGADSGGDNHELREASYTIFFTVSFMFFTQVSSRIGYVILVPMAPAERSRVGPYIRVLQLINCAVNLFIYYWRSGEFRRSCNRVFGIEAAIRYLKMKSGRVGAVRGLGSNAA